MPGKVAMAKAEQKVAATFDGRVDELIERVRRYMVEPPVVNATAGQKVCFDKCKDEVDAIIERQSCLFLGIDREECAEHKVCYMCIHSVVQMAPGSQTLTGTWRTARPKCFTLTASARDGTARSGGMPSKSWDKFLYGGLLL
ncbi:unnamed protein product [Polarella glacialis]|uniref:Uncharacterized protein n=1 Tax=Polarella glacialis TaxID=89957 RepID=A0A813JUC1_POLGL|nr:unnamed protein product [Polarella glacialis]